LLTEKDVLNGDSRDFNATCNEAEKLAENPSDQHLAQVEVG
jgi:hypothetical protein